MAPPKLTPEQAVVSRQRRRELAVGYRRKTYLRRKAAGECVRCGDPKPDGDTHAMCQSCRDRYWSWFEERRVLLWLRSL